MKRTPRVAIFLALSLLFFAGVTEVKAQHWTRLNPPTTDRVAPYFLNRNLGFIYVPYGNGIFRTTDGGMTWNTVIISNTTIRQLYFSDIFRGYAATSDGVYETNDTGKSWHKTFSGADVHSVYANDGAVFAFLGPTVGDIIGTIINFGPLMKSTDDGHSWTTILPASPPYWIRTTPANNLPYVFGNRDGLVYAASPNQQGGLDMHYSTDNGVTWNANIMDVDSTRKTMGFFSFPHCKEILRTFWAPAISPVYDDEYSVVYSSDFGAHWNPTFEGQGKTIPFIPEDGAWVAGNNCVQYLSDAGHIRVLFRSTDMGTKWRGISDPLGPDFSEVDDWDFHNLSVVGGGAVVYGGNGELWKTTDGGDGTLSANALASRISIADSLNAGATICDTSHLSIIFRNLSCNYALLKNIIIDGLDSTQFSMQWKHHFACDDVPDSVFLKIFPLHSGSGTLHITAHFVNDEYETIDTGITVTIVSSGSSSATATWYLKLTSLTAKAGDTVEIPLYGNGSEKISALGTTSLTYHFNTDLLTPFAFLPIAGVVADPVQVSKTGATVTLHFDPNFTFSAETKIGVLRCIAYVDDSLETDIALSGMFHSSNCITTLTDSNTLHFSIAECGAEALIKFMNGDDLMFVNIAPNPVKDFVKVGLSKDVGALRYELLDVFGKVQKSGTMTGRQLHIDLTGLTSGNYYFNLIGPGIPITKKITVLR